MSKKNIVITGFMGTGKTTVGQLVAHRTGRRFVDSDDEIVRRIGKSIPEIFATDGEDGFRRYEMIVCQSLASRKELVISTGGGMLVSEANRNVMMMTGFVVCLTAEPEVIKQRLADFENRPLAPDWQSLLAARREAYNQMPNQVDTSNKTPEAVAEAVIALWLASPEANESKY